MTLVSGVNPSSRQVRAQSHPEETNQHSHLPSIRVNRWSTQIWFMIVEGKKACDSYQCYCASLSLWGTSTNRSSTARPTFQRCFLFNSTKYLQTHTERHHHHPRCVAPPYGPCTSLRGGSGSVPPVVSTNQQQTCDVGRPVQQSVGSRAVYEQQMDGSVYHSTCFTDTQLEPWSGNTAPPPPFPPPTSSSPPSQVFGLN